MTHVKQMLDVLRNYYADREGQPHTLNDVQLAAYLDAFAEFSGDELEAAARQWIRAEKFFPRVSELLAMLHGPEPDWTMLGNKAWLTLESAISRGGAYRGVLFEDYALGETTRLVFGTWKAACEYDRDSAGWAIRRQLFLSQFEAVAKQGPGPMVVMRGLFEGEKPWRVRHLTELPAPKYQDSLSERAKEFLTKLEQRRQKQISGASDAGS